MRENNGISLAFELEQFLGKIDTGAYHQLISLLFNDPQMYQLGFIGAGKLAGSVIRGLVRAKFCPPKEILASEPNAETRAKLQSEVDIALTAENAEVAEKAEIIFIGVKPGVVLPLLREFSAKLQDKLVISLAAGARIASMEKAAFSGWRLAKGRWCAV